MRSDWISFPFRLKLLFSSFTAFIWKRYHTASPAVRICPATVATAAPIMPIFSGKMKIGSRMMFVIAPATVETMAKRGLPSERMIGFMAWPNI